MHLGFILPSWWRMCLLGWGLDAVLDEARHRSKEAGGPISHLQTSHSLISLSQPSIQICALSASNHGYIE